MEERRDAHARKVLKQTFRTIDKILYWGEVLNCHLKNMKRTEYSL